MAWVDSGTINVTANSVTVTGVGTNWLAETIAGVGLVAPDGRLYEVQNVASNTSLTLKKPYRGATATGQQYALAPMQGHSKAVADRLAEVAASLQNDYASVLRQSDLQDESALAAPEVGKILTTPAFGVGTMSRTWSAVTAGQSTGRWAKLCTVRAQGANRRGVLTVTGGAIGYGSGSDHSSAVGFLSLTSGNNSTEDNLLVDYVHSAGAYTNGSTGQTAIARLKTIRLGSNWDYELWALVGPHTQINLSYAGDLRIEPHTNITQETEPPGGYDKTTRIFRLWTSNGLNASNIGSVMGLKTGAFADIIGDVGAGAVMQSGSNANGRWWRFQSGLQVCIKGPSGNTWVDLASGSLWRSGSQFWNFPVEFLEPPTVSPFVESGGDGTWVGAGGDALTRLFCSYRTYNTVQIRSPVPVALMAVGRYK